MNILSSQIGKQEQPIINPEGLHPFGKDEFIGYPVEVKHSRFWGTIT